jgi:hypothetical protein
MVALLWMLASPSVLRPLFWNKDTHDIMVAVFIRSKVLLEVAHFHMQANIVTYSVGMLNESG